MTPAQLRLLVVVNPNASRSGDALPQVSEWFAGRGCATIVITKEQDDLERILKAEGTAADRIVIGGGDGTLSQALPVLLQLKKPVAVLPLGTANDFARTLGLSGDPLEAAATALGGREHQIDLGLANGKPYLNVASVGVASQVIEGQSKEMKRRWRVLAYAISLLQAARNLRPFIVEIDMDNHPRWTGPVYQVSIGNGRYHGGGLTVAENAAIDDGLLDLYVVYPGTFWQLFACLSQLRFGLLKPSVLDRHTARRVRLRTTSARPVDTDGHLATETPVEISLLRKGLTVLVPRNLPDNHRGVSPAR